MTIETMNDAAGDDARRHVFVQNLLSWYEREKRDLPWRRTRDPYAIWVSEMMLQQTQVATVIPFWERWMQKFPTVAALASADLEDVLKAWQGLGYYARARNLHRAAQVIMERHGGVFPDRYDDVLALPGIGRYTAGAICSIALGLDTPLVDTNVIRVLCRVFAIEGDPKTPTVQKRLWDLAEQLLPPGRASEFNQSMMELGAMVCLPAPRCPVCPVSEQCAALATGDPTALPQSVARPLFTTQTDVSAILRRGDTYLIIRRPAAGLWGGLWEFPRVTALPGEEIGAAAERAVFTLLGVPANAGENIGVVRHGVTSRKITLVGVACSLSTGANPQAVGCEAFVWANLDTLESYALSSPQVRLLSALRTHQAQPTLLL